jgi:hypothetical protein
MDRWSLEPAAIGLGFTAFIVYSLISALVLLPYFGVPYEAGFRATCYYYRKAYYRAYFLDPPACAVGEPSLHRRYAMETRFPFILQNLHRFFLYLAFIPLFFLFVDALASFRYQDQWRIGLGGVILSANVLLLAGFTFSCNSLRHLVGGSLDCFSCTAWTRTRHRAWRRVSGLNARHAVWAWASLASVVLADVYIRLLAVGAISDPALTF